MPSLEGVEVTLFRNITQTTGGHHVLLSNIYKGIRDGKWADQITRYRENPTEAAKANIGYFTGSCTCEPRNTRGIREHNGRIIMDFDFKNKAGRIINVPLKNINTIRSELALDQYTEAVFLSCGGKGLALVACINPERHMESFKFLEQYYFQKFQLIADPACKDIIRPRFLTYDPDIVVNTDCIQSPYNPYDGLELENNNTYDRVEYEQIRQLADYVLENNVDILSDYNDWLNGSFAIADAFREHGYPLFRDLSKPSPKYDSVRCQTQYNIALNRTPIPDTGSKITLGTLYHLAKQSDVPLVHIQRGPEFNKAVPFARQSMRTGADREQTIQQLTLIHGFTPDIARAVHNHVSRLFRIIYKTFWEVSLSPQGKIKIQMVRTKLIDFLARNGFYYAEVLPGVFQYVKIKENIIKEVTATEIKRFIIDYVKSLPNDFDQITRTELLETLLSQEYRLFTESFIDCIEYIRPNLLKDTQDTAWYYFQNVAVSVTATSVTPHSYGSLSGYVWQEQIVSHTLNLKASNNSLTVPELDSCDFAVFLSNLAGLHDNLAESKFNDRFLSLVAIIGYLLHGYKDPSRPIIPILCDTTIDDRPMGGTGKGLLMKCISKVIPTMIIDGKSFQFGGQFTYDRVSLSTRLLLFEDVGRNFQFTKLFNVATEGITVRKLYTPEFFIPFAESPKIGITTNYMITDEGDSVERRKAEFELSARYNKMHTPLDEFGRRFFDDWNQDEWDNFYSFMLCCVRSYLSNPNMMSKKTGINSEERSFLQKTPKMFPEFFASIERNSIHLKKSIFKEFLDETGYTSREVTINRFSFALKSAAEFYKLRLETGRNSSGHWIKLVDVPI